MDNRGFKDLSVLCEDNGFIMDMQCMFTMYFVEVKYDL